jgi:hypothetical protein
MPDSVSRGDLLRRLGFLLKTVDGAIIGQGGPSNTIFAQLWSSLATKYANQSKVIFGIMNEPWGV